MTDRPPHDGSSTPHDGRSAPLRVVVMDDQPVARAGLARLFDGSEFQICGEAETTAELLAQIDMHRPDAVIGETQLRGECVIELIPQLRRQSANLGVLFFSASDNPLDEARAYAGAANGYLYRTTSRDGLLTAARRSAQGGTLWTGADQRRLSSYLRDGRVVVGKFAPLTPREQQILKLLTTGATNREISAALEISHETVKEHVQHILKKIGVSDRTQAAVWAVRNGFA